MGFKETNPRAKREPDAGYASLVFLPFKGRQVGMVVGFGFPFFTAE
jgi:hypothetical protein